jgi:hypothetical protein
MAAVAEKTDEEYAQELEAARAAEGVPPAGQRTIDGGEVAVPLDELRLEGPAQLSMFDVGGKRATSATIKLTGGKVKLVEGTAFRKGDVITGTFTAVVNDVGQRDAHDPATGLVVSAEQRHGARITDLRVERLTES